MNKRHTKILGTLNKKTSNDMLREYIAAGMDGIRVFCDDGYETCKRLIDTVRGAAREGSRRVVVSIELMRKLYFYPPFISFDLINIIIYHHSN